MPGYTEISKAIIPLAAAACVACGARVTEEETAAWLDGAVQLFRKDGSTWSKLTGDFDSTYRKYGTWVPASGTLAAHCSQSFAFPASLFSHQKTYRIHATMRTARYGETKPIVFKNWYYPH